MTARSSTALLIDSDVLDLDDRRLRSVLLEAAARCRKWQRDNEDQLLPLEGLKALELFERHCARRRVDRRNDRRLALAERRLLLKEQIDDAMIEAELDRLLARRLSEMEPEQLLELARVKRLEERSSPAGDGDGD